MAIQNKKEGKDKFVLYEVAIAWQLGFFIILTITGFAFLGYFVDVHFKTSPLFLIAGIIIGIAITIEEIFELLKPFIKQ